MNNIILPYTHIAYNCVAYQYNRSYKYPTVINEFIITVKASYSF